MQTTIYLPDTVVAAGLTDFATSCFTDDKIRGLIMVPTLCSAAGFIDWDSLARP